jgi:hypothetical protein
MSRDLVPRGHGTPTMRTGEVSASLGRSNEISTRSSGQLDYILSELVGFDYVPQQVVRQLRREGVIAEAGIAAWAEPPVARRRADSSVYQVVTAWWADSTSLVVFEVVRDLEDVGSGRFRPTEAWVPRGTVYQFPPGISAVTYSSTPEAGDLRKDSGGVAAIAGSPLDVLPEYIQPQLRGGAAGACLHTRRRWVRETVVAQRLDRGRVRVLRAEREGKSQQSLAGSPWAITSIDAPVAGSWRISPSPHSPSAVARKQHALPIEPPRPYW